MVDFQIQITVPKEERRDPEKLYNKMTLGELSNNFTGVSVTTQLITNIFLTVTIRLLQILLYLLQ
jgi:adenylylsulfate kinase-like enzyme